jgi:tRNA-dihydrouridine synthase A
MPPPPVISVAPMVDVTGRHFRYLVRLMSKRTTLWTPMFVARRLATRKRHVVDQMLRFHPDELQGGLVAQLGGDDPKTMISAALKCQAAGYSEVNINLGCPARNAQAGNHGAMLMRPPHDNLVHLVREMTQQLSVPVSLKIRLGVDEYESYEFLRDYVGRLHEEGGCNRFVVHARKALLGGLPPGTRSNGGGGGGSGATFVTTRQNRLSEVVPLRYEWVHRLQQEIGPRLERMEINGGEDAPCKICHMLQSVPHREIHVGVKSLAGVRSHLKAGMDGVMIGRLGERASERFL